MDENLPMQVVEALEALADKLGPSAEALWGVAMAQVWTSAAMASAGAVLFLAASLVLGWISFRTKHEEVGIPTMTGAAFFGILALIWIIGAGAEVIQAAMNPEWAALEHLRSLAP